MRRVESATAVPDARLSLPKTARRRRRRNRRRVRLPLDGLKRFVFSARWLSLGLLGLCIYALYLVGMNEDFYLTRIPVQGTISISPSEIVDQSGLAGAHVFSADPNRAAARIAEMPGVISATVTLNWPSDVRIQIREDSPVALWLEGRDQFWVTKDGRLIPARSQSPGLMVIDAGGTAAAAKSAPATAEQTDVEADVTDTTTAVAATPETEEPARDFVPPTVLAGALQLRELRPNIDKLFYEPGAGLSYQDGRGWRVYFGSGTNMDQKLVVYETIVEQLLAQGLTPEYISVSNQEKPYYLAQ